MNIKELLRKKSSQDSSDKNPDAQKPLIDIGEQPSEHHNIYQSPTICTDPLTGKLKGWFGRWA